MLCAYSLTQTIFDTTSHVLVLALSSAGEEVILESAAELELELT